MGVDMSEAEQWREHIAELRQVAEHTADAERHRKLLALADRWEEYAEALAKTEHQSAA